MIKANQKTNEKFYITMWWRDVQRILNVEKWAAITGVKGIAFRQNNSKLYLVKGKKMVCNERMSLIWTRERVMKVWIGGRSSSVSENTSHRKNIYISFLRCLLGNLTKEIFFKTRFYCAYVYQARVCLLLTLYSSWIEMTMIESNCVFYGQ